MTWPTKKLGDVIELKYGRGISRADRSPSGKYPVYGANGILDHSDKYLVDGAAIIVGRKGSAGEVTRVSGKFWPSDVTYFVLGNKQIDIDYLFHLFKNLNLQRFAVGVKPGINRNRVYELEIPLPPLSEQKKIVAKLERVLAKISEVKKLRAEARENADNLLPSELHKIFSIHQQHPYKLENVGMSSSDKNGWEEKELGSVATLVRGPFGGSLKKEIFVSAGDCVYEQGNVIDNDLEIFRYYIIPEKFEEMKRFAVSAGDILMSCSGTIGKFVIIPRDFKKGIINQALLKITPSQKITAAFLKYALEDYLLLSNTHVKGMAIKNIAAVKELKKIKNPLPPLAEQKKIVKHLDSLSQKLQKLQEYQKSTRSDLLTFEQAILQKAFL